MSEEKPRRIVTGELVFGVVFVVLGVIDLWSRNTGFGAGFLALGVGVILATPLVHRFLKVKAEGPFTWLRIISYLLAAFALVMFIAEIFGGSA